MDKYYKTKASIIDMSKIIAIETDGYTNGHKVYTVVFDNGAKMKYETNKLLESYLDYLKEKGELKKTTPTQQSKE